MGKLAIKGNEIKGYEVIKILESIGGKLRCNLTGRNRNHYYFIDHEGYINYSIGIPFGDFKDISLRYNSNYQIYTLEEFFEKYPHKIGDTVKIPNCDVACRVTNMTWNGIEIEYETTNSDVIFFADELQPITNDKKISFPKNYNECCEILLERASSRNNIGYKGELIVNFQKLILCRNAYWFVYNNWKPTHKSGCDNTIYTIHRFNDEVIKGATQHRHSLLEFPTEEMRDEFYENFKTLIFACKELI